MFDELKKLKRGNTSYIKLKDLEYFLCGDSERIQLDECWLTPFYITGHQVYEFYFLKLVVYKNLISEEYEKVQMDYKLRPSNSVGDAKEICCINIDESISRDELIEKFKRYILFIKNNREIVDLAIEISGDFDINNVYFECIE